MLSYKISILSMLPGLLNSQYDKVIMATDKLGEEGKATLLQGQSHILFSPVVRYNVQAILICGQSGHVTVDYLAKKISRILRLRSIIVFKDLFSRLWLFSQGLETIGVAEISC